VLVDSGQFANVGNVLATVVERSLKGLCLFTALDTLSRQVIFPNGSAELTGGSKTWLYARGTGMPRKEGQDWPVELTYEMPWMMMAGRHCQNSASLMFPV
jgi:hypothetical protein